MIHFSFGSLHQTLMLGVLHSQMDGAFKEIPIMQVVYMNKSLAIGSHGDMLVTSRMRRAEIQFCAKLLLPEYGMPV